MATKASNSDGAVVLTRIQRHRITVPIAGDSPLIPHKWSEKALRMMRESQSGGVRAKKEPKEALAEAEGCQYYLPDGRPGMPATAFKAAIVGACRLFDGLTMTLVKSAIFVEGVGPEQLVPIVGEREIHEDTPRNATGVADLRYRYYYHPWSAELTVSYLPNVIDPASVGTLVDAAGNGGVGDWRPSAPKSATGTFGRFHVID